LQIAVPGLTQTRLVTLDDGVTVKQARNERRRLQAAGRPVVQSAAGPGTVHELAVAYLRATAPLLAPSTTRGTEDAYRRHVAPTLRDVRLADLKRPQVEAWLGGLLAAGVSTHGARKALAALRVILSFAVRAGELDRNPAFGVRLADPPSDPDQPRPVERVLDPSETAILLGACETAREEAICRLACESGLRSGEVRGLRFPDLDLRARRVHVRRAVWRNIVKQPKSRSSVRRVALTDACADALGRHYEDEVLARGRDAGGYVFTGRNGESFMGADTPLEVVQAVQRRAGLVTRGRDGKTRPRVTYHELRHTSASTMLVAGVPAPVVARQLGHASSQVTTSVYEHLLDDGLLDVALQAFRPAPDVGDEAPDVQESVRIVAGGVAGPNQGEAEIGRNPA
jgi:integrase